MAKITEQLKKLYLLILVLEHVVVSSATTSEGNKYSFFFFFFFSNTFTYLRIVRQFCKIRYSPHLSSLRLGATNQG